MYHFDKIKLVIWDLDETFWKGTISEGTVEIPQRHRQLLQQLTDIGVVNSICSKNDFAPTMAYLEQSGLAEYFVFPSINWNPKGQRVKQLIADMQLRPSNVLFLDDNPSNLGEAEHFCPEIMTGGPEIIPQLAEDAKNADKKDRQQKRLAQYRVLEEKHQAKEAFSSNEEFLYESNIRLEIATDCMVQLERLHDLIIRSNQLNFTKVRSTLEELEEVLKDPTVSCGYVSVRDKFGDYGIVGFYALKDKRLIHFVFSCRTLGMGIEQYVYNKLARPDLDIVGEVISDLSGEAPGWINRNIAESTAQQMKIGNLTEHAVLVKGPCDLFQIYPYIANTELFDTEFTYSLPRGLTVESTGHTTNVVEALRLSPEQKRRVLEEVPFTDGGMYRDDIFKRDYRVVFLSILTDCNLGVYRRKDTGERLAFVEYLHPVTDPANWPGLISGQYPTAGFKFTEDILRKFSENYEFLGRNTPEQIVENLTYIRRNLPEGCVLTVMLGGELYYEKNTFEAYMDRHIVHKTVNAAIRAWAEGQRNVRLMDVNRYLKDQSSFYDHFNHYIKPVYYALAAEMVEIVNEATGSQLRETSKMKMVLIRLKEALAPTYYKLRKLLKR